MKHYVDYMDRQTLSPERLHKLEQLRPRPQRPWMSWRRWGALAACCAVLVGLGLSMTRPVQTSPVELPPASAAQSAPDRKKQTAEFLLDALDSTGKLVLDDAAPSAAPLVPGMETALSPEENQGGGRSDPRRDGDVLQHEGRGRPKMDRRPDAGAFGAERRILK